MEATLKYLDIRAKEIRDSLTHFMLNHSAIAPRNPEEVVCVSPEGDRYYESLDGVGTKMQAYLLECYRQFYSMLLVLLKDQPEDMTTKASKYNTIITRTIEHRITWCESSNQALHVALAALEDQLKIMKDLYKGEK